MRSPPPRPPAGFARSRAPIRPHGPPAIASCAASPATTRALRPKLQLAPHHRRPVRPDVHAVRDRCAPTSPASTSPARRASPTSSRTGQTEVARFMPTAGVEYRYPFINVQSWGTQTIEPIAQLVVQPERNQDRRAAERGFAKLHVRRQQPVPRQQVRGLGSRRGRRTAQCRAASTPPSSIRAAISTSCSASPTICSG